MDPHRHDLEVLFQSLADEELLRRCASGELTDFAQSIALKEVRVRGLTPREAPQAPPPPAGDYQGDWVIVARYLSFTEVHLLKSRLESAGIPAMVGDAHLIQTDALLTPAMRGANVRVPAAYVREALEIVAAFKRGDFRLADDFDPDQEQH
jgi:hypothetical protein